MGVPGGMGVVRSMAGSLLWLRRDPGTTAGAATAGLSVKSSSKHKNWTSVSHYTNSSKYGCKSVSIVLKTKKQQSLLKHQEINLHIAHFGNVLVRSL